MSCIQVVHKQDLICQINCSLKIIPMAPIATQAGLSLESSYNASKSLQLVLRILVAGLVDTRQVTRIA